MLYIHDSCNNLLQELPSYHRKANGKPNADNTTACATLRYLVTGVDGEQVHAGMSMVLDDDSLSMESAWRV